MPESSYRVAGEELIASDIEAYLQLHEKKDLLRILTCGSVDDGKSTLIGRLLYDTKMIYEDQLAALHRDSAAHGTTNTDFDPALLTDGLKAEREQGITIDVAYRYFSTDRRKFIVADTPGHEQYTRNMATGASTCELAIVLIDARHGVLTQTRRHSFIVSLLGIKHVVVAVNKMDLVDWSEDVLNQIRQDYLEFAAKLEIPDIQFIPMSALQGDNVVERSDNMPWYQGSPLLPYLETINVVTDKNLIDLRFPVQYVIRPDLDFRGYAGTVASGIVRKGDEVMALPSRQRSRVKSIVTYSGELEEAYPPLAVTITLEDQIDLSRGDMLVHLKNAPRQERELDAMVVWMSDDTLKKNRPYDIKHTTRLGSCEIADILYKMDVNTLHKQDADELALNEIGRVKIYTHKVLMVDPYRKNRDTGSFIIIDRISNVTVGAGMILDREQEVKEVRDIAGVSRDERLIHPQTSLVTAGERQVKLNQKAATLWLTGLPKAGKTTVAYALERHLHDLGYSAYVLDGENLRRGLCEDLGFSARDREEQARRAAAVARCLNEAGLIVIVATVSPYKEDRDAARDIIGSDRFSEVFVKASLETCKARDSEEMYSKAESDEISLFTGVSSPYENPENPEVTISTEDMEPSAAVETLFSFLKDGLIDPE